MFSAKMPSFAFWQLVSKLTDIDPLGRILEKMDAPEYDVFLGGSCGMTQWRQQMIIPELEKLGVTYYNPQVTGCNVWNEELLRKEEQAKLNSKLLLMVIQHTTVSAVSLMEISYLTAKEAPLVVVLPTEEDFLEVASSSEDYRDRKRMFEFLSTLLQRHNVPTFSSLMEAKYYLEEKLICSKHFSEAILNGRCRWSFLKSRFMRIVHSVLRIATILTTVFKIPTGCFNLSKREFMESMRKWQPASQREYFRWVALILEFSLLMSLVLACPCCSVVFLVICILVAHWVGYCMPSKPVRISRGNSLSSVRRKKNGIRPATYDVYLAGCGTRSDSDWMAQIAVPLLNKNGLSHTDDLILGEDCEKRFLAMEHCSRIVYHISSPYSYLSGLVKLAYCIGRGWKVSASVCKTSHLMLDDNDNLTKRRKSSVDERNMALIRGMKYLENIAGRSNVAIFYDLRKSLNYVIQELIYDEFGVAQ